MRIGDYYFGWNHAIAPVANGTRVQMITACGIYKDKELIRSVKVGNHQNDYPSHDKGRRASLTKLLGELKIVEPEIFHRKFRAEIWEVYRTMTKIPRWKPKQLKRNFISPSVKSTEEKSTQPTLSPTPTAG